MLYFDFSDIKEVNRDELIRNLNHKLAYYEKIYGVEEATEPNLRLGDLIRIAYEKTGHPVVVLFDEYDSPLINSMYNNARHEELRQVMQSFYSPLKLSNLYLKFVFITGITKFSQVSIFSALNNIRNISMLNEFAGICGITDEELHSQLDYDVELLAHNLSKTKDEMYAKLKENYDGYHFSPKSADIYNPYSLLNAFNDKQISPYWFSSGTPTYIIKMLDKFQVQPSDIGNFRTDVEDFDTHT